MTTTPADATVRIERTIAAPPDAVYRAWLEPETLVRWLGPGAYTAARAEVDPRVGGRHRIWHVDADGTDMGGSEAVFVELVANERIAMSFHFVGADRIPLASEESLLTITLQPGPGAGSTDLTLEHSRLGGLRAAHPEIADNVAAGWADVLDTLTKLEF